MGLHTIEDLLNVYHQQNVGWQISINGTIATITKLNSHEKIHNSISIDPGLYSDKWAGN